MIKLNQKGWGILPFLIFMSVFFVSILVVIYMINNFDNKVSPRQNEEISYTGYDTYKKYERIIKKSLDKDFYSNVVNISELAISNAIKSQCLGYALYDDNKDDYDVYLKCNNYKTLGFSNDYLK